MECYEQAGQGGIADARERYEHTTRVGLYAGVVGDAALPTDLVLSSNPATVTNTAMPPGYWIVDCADLGH